MSTGSQLLADDMVALYPERGHWSAYPGVAQVRMWPDTIRHLYGMEKAEALPRVHAGFEKRLVRLDEDISGSLCRTPLPVSAVYLLDPVTDSATAGIGIETMAPADGLIALLGHSVIGAAAKAMGLEECRLRTLGRVAQHVPVKRLRFPSGYEHLPRVCEALRSDLHAAGTR